MMRFFKNFVSELMASIKRITILLSEISGDDAEIKTEIGLAAQGIIEKLGEKIEDTNDILTALNENLVSFMKTHGELISEQVRLTSLEIEEKRMDIKEKAEQKPPTEFDEQF